MHKYIKLCIQIDFTNVCSSHKLRAEQRWMEKGEAAAAPAWWSRQGWKDRTGQQKKREEKKTKQERAFFVTKQTKHETKRKCWTLTLFIRFF